jgi:hypothetical protein
MQRALLLAAVLALSPLDGLAGEKQIVDVKELAGSWRGWVSEVAGDEWATVNRSSRTTPLAMPSAEVLGAVSVSEEPGKTLLTLTPEDPNYLGRAEYGRVR